MDSPGKRLPKSIKSPQRGWIRSFREIYEIVEKNMFFETALLPGETALLPGETAVFILGKFWCECGMPSSPSMASNSSYTPRQCGPGKKLAQ